MQLKGNHDYITQYCFDQSRVDIDVHDHAFERIYDVGIYFLFVGSFVYQRLVRKSDDSLSKMNTVQRIAFLMMLGYYFEYGRASSSLGTNVQKPGWSDV